MKSKGTGVDIGTWCVRRIAVPSGDVAECRDIGFLAIDTIATADLVHIARAREVAVRIRMNMLWPIVTTPALGVVLSASECVASSCTLSNASFVGVAVTTRDLSLELTTGIILQEATSIPIFRLLGDQVKGWCLLRDCIADELNLLLLKGQIIEIHRPLHSTIVSIDVNLRFWNRAVERGSHVLPSIDQSAFS